MKKRTIIIISAAALCVIAACVLYLTGVIRFPGREEESVPQKPVFYVEYINTCMLVDADGTVTGSAAEAPTDIPKLNGISFARIIVGQELIPTDPNTFEYGRKVIDALSRNGVFVDEVYISSDLQATMYIGKVKVLLGVDDKTDEKIRDLRDFYEDLKDLSGTLDMQQLSVNNKGYSLRPDK